MTNDTQTLTLMQSLSASTHLFITHTFHLPLTITRARPPHASNATRPM
jgi:hypothetical protein